MGFQRRSAWIGFLSCTPASIERFDWSFCPVRLYPCLMRPPQTHTLCSLSGHKQKQFQRRRLNCHHALDGFFSYQATTQKPNRWSALGSFYHVSFDMILNLHLSLVPLQSNRHLWFQGKKTKCPSVLPMLKISWQLTMTTSPPIRMSASSPPVYSNLSLHWQRGLAKNFNINVIAVSWELVRMLCLQCYTGKISEEW